MPAKPALASARVLGPEQAASTTNGAGRAPEGKHHREHAPPPPTGAVERAMPAIPTPAKPPTIPQKTR